jgi:hypothetical protein
MIYGAVRQSYGIGDGVDGRRIVDLRTRRAAGTTAHRFGCAIDGVGVSVRAGSVRFHGIGIAHCAATSLSLAMSPTWVSVAVSRASLSAEIVATSTEPQSDYATLYLPLVVIEGVTAEESTSWRIIERCHEGDFDFDLPLR